MPTILITGANRGIGLALTRRFLGDGHDVIATARDPGRAGDLRATGAAVERLDADDEGSITDLARRLGDRPIDVLVNNAGVFLDRDATSVLETTPDDLMATVRTNVAGPMVVTAALAPSVERSERKVIVHVSSDFASIATTLRNNWRGYAAYRCSKAALNMLCALQANELGPRGVTTVALHPGWVRTDMGGPEAPLTADDAADAIAGVIERLTPGDNGRFLSYTGDAVAW